MKKLFTFVALALAFAVPIWIVYGQGGAQDFGIRVTPLSTKQDFGIRVTPLSIQVEQGAEAVYSVNVRFIGGYLGPVDLRASGAPEDSQVSFSKSSLTSEDAVNGIATSWLTIRTSSRTPFGAFLFTITGSGTIGGGNGGGGGGSTHLSCVGSVCARVAGAGLDACAPESSSCGGTPPPPPPPTIDFWPDIDGDSFGDMNTSPTLVAQGDPIPSGYVADNTDCADNDSNTNPGQGSYFTTPGGKGFDYNCDGAEEKQYNNSALPSCTVIFSCSSEWSCNDSVASITAGWCNDVAACGTASNFLTGGNCTVDPTCDNIKAIYRVGLSVVSQVQGCR